MATKQNQGAQAHANPLVGQITQAPQGVPPSVYGALQDIAGAVRQARENGQQINGAALQQAMANAGITPEVISNIIKSLPREQQDSLMKTFGVAKVEGIWDALIGHDLDLIGLGGWSMLTGGIDLTAKVVAGKQGYDYLKGRFFGGT